MAAGQWQSLVANMGAEMAEALRQTMAGVAELQRSRRIGQHEARWLQEPLQRLYQAGVSAQKLSRLAERKPRATAVEPVSLNELVADTVAHHLQTHPKHEISADLAPLDVMAEPESLAGAMDALLGWAVNLGRDVNIRLVRPAGAARGELWVRIAELNERARQDHHLNSMQWYMLWQLARLKGVKIKRKIDEDRIRVMVRFDRVLNQHSGLAVLEMGSPDPAAPAFDPDHTEVWLLVPDRALAGAVGAALMGRVRNVRAVADLRALADDSATPDCLVSVPDLIDTDAFRQWRKQAQRVRGRTIAVIEITPTRNVFDIGGFGPRSVARISADSVVDDRGNAFYIVRLRTREASLGEGLPIIPGMVAQVDILTGKKTVLDYLLKPVLRAKANALSER